MKQLTLLTSLMLAAIMAVTAAIVLNAESDPEYKPTKGQCQIETCRQDMTQAIRSETVIRDILYTEPDDMSSEGGKKLCNYADIVLIKN